MAKANYLNNKDLLAEIHKSKCSYSYYIDDRHARFDAIIYSLDEITPVLIQATREGKAKLIEQEEKKRQKAEGKKPHQIKVDPIDPASIPVEDLVWRLMTFEHIPFEPGRVSKPKKEADYHAKLLFPPFKHYVLDDGEPREVCRSHWEGGFENGQFAQDQGKLTNKLARMFMMLVERYARRGNWRGYTYNDEMQSQALLQLCSVGLQFDESRSDNPFAYYTVTVSNAFTRVLNLEKREANKKDDLRESAGIRPSASRQSDNAGYRHI